MEFLLVNHPLDCPICDQGGECDLQVSFFSCTVILTIPVNRISQWHLVLIGVGLLIIVLEGKGTCVLVVLLLLLLL